MPAVAFHFNASDKQAYAVRLLRKAFTRGARTHVLLDREMATRLEVDLWIRAAGDFLPHCLDDSPAPVLRRSPIVLGPSVMQVQPEAQVLVNLSEMLPDSGLIGRYQRIIEVVSTSPRDRELARQRWRWYRESGMEPERHDLGASEGSTHQ